MMTKIGRNQPCPCGSGNKYKKCCLSKAVVPPQVLAYRRLSEAHDRLVDRLIAYAERIFGEEAVEVAMHEFLLWPEAEDEISEDMLDRSGHLFWPWYIFNWEYDPYDGAELKGPEGRTVAELYAEKRCRNRDTLERRLIDGINRKPYSFLEVLSVNKGEGMTLKDILRGDRISVQERTGSQYVQTGDILFGRAVSVDGVGMLIGLAPTRIPPGSKTDIIQLRKRLRSYDGAIFDDTLYEWDNEIRELYFHLDHALHSPPQMCNTDGHALEFHKLVYELPSIEAAFKKLRGLCVTLTPEELAEDVECDEAGRMVRVEIPWDRLGHKKMSGLPNTVLGRIVLAGRRLTAEVNSAERADALRREIEARLGSDACFKVDEIQDFDAMMSRHAAGSAESIKLSVPEDPIQHPEVQAQLVEVIDKHWESWADQELPVLGGNTPKEAVKTEDGREAVEALLKDAERSRGQDPIIVSANRKGARRVREMLGLKDLTDS